MKFAFLLITLWCSGKVESSECGESTIPYSLEVLPSGQPILGCARPTCFGYNSNGHQLPTAAKFFLIDQQPDGFLREDPSAISPFDAVDPRVYAERQATCEREFQSLSCASEDQWVGGIAPMMNASNVVAYQCCTYQPLRASTDRGVATVAGGQIVIGGEVKENEKQYAFDYISNIVKKLDEEGDVYYEVNIRRFSCLDLQNVDRSVAEILNSENIIRHVNGQKAAAHQVPNAEVGAPIDLVAPDGVVDGQDVVIEEIVAQPGFVQPETSTTPVPPPPAEIQPGQAPQGFQPGFQQGFQQPQGFQPGFQQGFQPQGFQQGFQPQGFQPAVQQPEGFPAAPNYGGVPVGFSAPAGLQLYYCFPGDVTVGQSGGKPKRMDKVQVGDWVQALMPSGREVALVQVTSWLHRDPEQVADFLEFYLDNGETFTLTEKHLVYVTNCPPHTPKDHHNLLNNPVNAENVKVGDCFYIGKEDLVKKRMYSRVKVLDIKTVTKTGIYAPMTSVGHILVNKVHVSCNSETDVHTLQKSFFENVLSMKNSFVNFIGLESDKELGISYGANALLEVLDLLLPLKMIS